MLGLLYPEDEGATILQNVTNDLPIYMVNIPEDLNINKVSSTSLYKNVDCVTETDTVLQFPIGLYFS
jgi:hypothetical protein